MKIPPHYTDAQWQADHQRADSGELLKCPDCGHDEYFVVTEQGVREDGSPRRYRGCKVCGFWHEADGKTEPERCRLTDHICLGSFATTRKCLNCNNPMSQGLRYHLCPRILQPAEEKTCEECGTALGSEYTVPWVV